MFMIHIQIFHCLLRLVVRIKMSKAHHRPVLSISCFVKFVNVHFHWYTTLKHTWGFIPGRNPINVRYVQDLSNNIPLVNVIFAVNMALMLLIIQIISKAHRSMSTFVKFASGHFRRRAILKGIWGFILEKNPINVHYVTGVSSHTMLASFICVGNMALMKLIIQIIYVTPVVENLSSFCDVGTAVWISRVSCEKGPICHA